MSSRSVEAEHQPELKWNYVRFFSNFLVGFYRFRLSEVIRITLTILAGLPKLEMDKTCDFLSFLHKSKLKIIVPESMELYRWASLVQRTELQNRSQNAPPVAAKV
jgi:hypothetical protein